MLIVRENACSIFSKNSKPESLYNFYFHMLIKHREVNTLKQSFANTIRFPWKMIQFIYKLTGQIKTEFKSQKQEEKIPTLH